MAEITSLLVLYNDASVQGSFNCAGLILAGVKSEKGGIDISHLTTESLSFPSCVLETNELCDTGSGVTFFTFYLAAFLFVFSCHAAVNT